MKRLKRQTGFTLIEIIVVLIIMGIVAVFLGNAIVYGVQSYIFARNADQLSQKAQLALARINKELIGATAVSTAAADQIDYSLTKNIVSSCEAELPDACKYSIKRTGTQITLEKTYPAVIGAQVLIDGLNADYYGPTNNFLNYFKTDETPWVTTDGFDSLAKIEVRISLDVVGSNNPLNFEGTINPRENSIPNVPQYQ
jgi:prepilin-type N-terminal cleavage/methylation domain-containing protein